MSASVKPQIVIKDACILFDLIDLELLEQFYCLELIVITTSQVLGEIVNDDQMEKINRFIELNKLEIDQFGDFELIASITYSNPGLSFSDASVIEVAARRNAHILSSDKSLRNESTRRNIVVRGMLWVLEELFLQEIIDQSILVEKLEAYPTINPRAPKKEIENLLNKYNPES